MLKKVWGADGPSAILAVPGYLKAGEVSGQALPGYAVRWDDGATGEERWAAEQANRFLAARVAVGTIDQALLGTLPVRHALFRSSVLARSLLVVDEVHASDAYMTGLLERLLDHHVAAGGQALLLSATLGAAARAKLLHQPRPSPEEAQAVPYPALSGRGVAPRAAAGTTGRDKDVAVEIAPILEDAGAIATLAVAAARDGAAVLVVRNSVAGVVAVAQAVAELAPDLAFAVNGVATVHHGRFAAQDRMRLDDAVTAAFGKGRERGGRVLVGTQTLEQSLDIDADLLVTDLAPIDVLLQRIGRLHRHPERERGAFADPRAIVLRPAERDLTPLLYGRASHGLGGAKRVAPYPDMLPIEATLALLEAMPRIAIPRDNRMLVERALHPDVLDGLADRLGGDWQNHRRQRNGGALVDAETAAQIALDLGKRFTALAPFDDGGAVATRLGARDLLVDLPDPLAGAFGGTIDRIKLPAWWLVTGAESAAVERIDAQRFALGAQRFRYDRWGLGGTERNLRPGITGGHGPVDGGSGSREVRALPVPGVAMTASAAAAVPPAAASHPGRSAMLLYGLLGFSAGLPFYMFSTVLALRLQAHGVALTVLGFFAWVQLLPTLKFVWAPLLDRYDVPGFSRFWGKRRGWIMLAQLGIVTAMGAMAWTADDASLPVTALFAVLLAFWTTTLEVAADAWRIELFPTQDQQGPIVAANLWGYRTAMVAAGSGALLLADNGGWALAYLLVAVAAFLPFPILAAMRPEAGRGGGRMVALLTGIGGGALILGAACAVTAAVGYALLSAAAGIGIDAKSNVTPWVLGLCMVPFLGMAAALPWIRKAPPTAPIRTSTAIGPYVDFFWRFQYAAILLMVFVSLYRMGDVLALNLSKPMIKELGYSLSQIGRADGIVALAASMVGVGLGGWMVARRPMLWALAVGAVVAAIGNFGFVWLAHQPVSEAMLYVATALDQFGNGFAGAVFVVYLSLLVNPRYPGAQYAFLTGFAFLLPRMLAGAGGSMVGVIGYDGFFLLSGAVSLAAIPLLPALSKIRPREDDA